MSTSSFHPAEEDMHPQLLTTENLSRLASSTPPPEVTRADRIAQFQASLYEERRISTLTTTSALVLPAHGSFPTRTTAADAAIHASKRSRKQSSSSNNVAIDAFPLPFPYHNDAFFIPVVESGHTKYDSPTACSSIAAAAFVTTPSDRYSTRSSDSGSQQQQAPSYLPPTRPRPSSYLTPPPPYRSSSTPPDFVWWRRRESIQVQEQQQQTMPSNSCCKKTQSSRISRLKTSSNSSSATLSTIQSISLPPKKSPQHLPPPHPFRSSCCSSTSTSTITCTIQQRLQQRNDQHSTRKSSSGFLASMLQLLRHKAKSSISLAAKK